MDNRLGMHALVESSGYAVMSAATGEQGLDLAAVFRPDVVILDVRLPGMDGYAFAETLRAREAAPPVLIAYSGDAHVATNGSFDCVVLKPNIEGLLAALCRRREAKEPGAA